MTEEDVMSWDDVNDVFSTFFRPASQLQTGGHIGASGDAFGPYMGDTY